MITSANSYINGKRIKVSTKYCDTNFWEITGYEFLEGKPFNQTNIANGDRVVVITDAMREQFFDNSSESVIGKMVEVDNEKYKVIGVVKAGPVTRILTFSDMFFPYNLPKSNYQRTGLQGTFVAIIEANSASDFPEIRSEFDNNVSKIPVPINIGNTKYTIIDTHAQTYTDTMLYGVFHQEIGNKFYIVVGLVLLMLMGLPAINLVNLNVSRILERASEIGVRKAFGAPTRTLAFQFIVENIFITFIGGAIALIMTSVGIYLFNRSGLILYSDLTINLPVFGVSLLVCLVFGLLSGVAPAFRMAKMKVIDALKRQ
jgi:putative ABC transport system permease protein